MAVNLDGVLISAGKSVLANLADAHGYYDRKLACASLLSPQSILSRQGLMADDEFCPWAEQRLASIMMDS